MAGLAVLFAAAAEAAVLVEATWTQHIQGIDLTVTDDSATCSDTDSTHAQPTIVCPTGGLRANGFSNSTSYSVSLTMPLFDVDQFTTGGAIAIHTAASLQGPASINGSAGMATGGPNVGGMVTVKAAAHVMGSMYEPREVGLTLLKLPLSVDKAGAAYQYFKILTVPHYLTVDLYGWTPGTKTFTGLTSKYLPLPTPTVVAMGSFNLTARRGTVTLVAPSKISIDGMLAQRRTVSFTSLKLTYVPEPGTLLLVSASALGLLLFRRHAA